MAIPKTVEEFLRDIVTVTTADDLDHLMRRVVVDLGFQYYALTHHVDVRSTTDAIRLHNYPERWAEHYDRLALGVSDPVHRASHRTSIGFLWSRIPALVPLTNGDRRILADGAAQGIGDGFTVPAHVPGERRGSCSFANERGRPLDPATLALAQLVGNFAFEAARQVWGVRGPLDAMPVLTDRQRDCILWSARGKGDWEISRILGVTQETVAMHVKQARRRYDVGKRSLVAIQALFDGTLSFDDILRR